MALSLRVILSEAEGPRRFTDDIAGYSTGFFDFAHNDPATGFFTA